MGDRHSEGQRDCAAEQPKWSALWESFQLASWISQGQNKEWPKQVIHFAGIYSVARNSRRSAGALLMPCASLHVAAEVLLLACPTLVSNV